VPELSLVAVGDDNEIVGFVMLSCLEVRGDRRWNAPALAPLTADLRGTVWYSPDFIETGSVPGL
jgi:predicted N-acetyltransferase YhbS